MRLSELVGTPVVCFDGKSLGVVKDVLATQDGPQLGPDARLMVRAVLVGRPGFGSHLGYSRPNRQRGPWMIEAFVRWHQGRVLKIDWEDLRLVDGRYVLAESAVAVAIGRTVVEVAP